MLDERDLPRAQAMQDEFSRLVAQVRAGIDGHFPAWLEARVELARSRGADVERVADAVRQLALRGGKRLRGALLAAAFRACGGDGGVDSVLPACVGLELFQVYLLVHDDWMDGDDVRRGGPSVPALIRALFPGKQADAASVLAGDLAAAWSRSALLELELPAARIVQALGELARVEEEVVEGQILDVTGTPTKLAEVEAVHSLKTASYTSRGPVLMGARLAGASDAQVSGLAAFAEPLGVAFQLRDDLLGVFGDAAAMGKPAGSDLRAGKRTAVVVEGLRDPAIHDSLARAFGRPDSSDAEVRAAVACIDASGARERVEGRIDALVRESRAALGGLSLDPVGRGLLEGAVVAMTERQA